MLSLLQMKNIYVYILFWLHKKSIILGYYLLCSIEGFHKIITLTRSFLCATNRKE